MLYDSTFSCRHYKKCSSDDNNYCLADAGCRNDYRFNNFYFSDDDIYSGTDFDICPETICHFDFSSGVWAVDDSDDDGIRNSLTEFTSAVGKMNSVIFLETHTIPFLDIFVRVSGIFFFTPIFSSREIPLITKGWLSAGIALVLYPIVSPYLPHAVGFDMGLMLLLTQEAIIGILIGLIIAVYYNAFLLAGEFYSLQMGFGIVNVIDPLSQTSIPILGELKSLFAIMLFITFSGHHMLMEALVYSFKVLPEFGIAAGQPMATGMIVALREMFSIAFQIAAPVIGTVFIIELVMGIMSKVAPQMNIMVIGFQIKIVAGIFVVMFLIPALVTVTERLFDRAFFVTQGILRWM